MTTAVLRPDLSTRTAVSKSALVGFDLCATKSWYGIHDPRPFIPNEKVVFGSAVDAGVEVILTYARMGQPVDFQRVVEAASFVIERDGVEVSLSEVLEATDAFHTHVVPNYDWSLTRLQSGITVTLDDLGECNGHPDIVLGSNDVWDVKTSSRAKNLPSVELGFYALLVEAETGRPVPNVGYFNWIRLKRPYWQVVSEPVTDELRRWAYENAAAYVRARKADALLNAKAAVPVNWSMGGGPKFDGLCSDCPYSPALGGPCVLALREMTDDSAA